MLPGHVRLKFCIALCRTSEGDGCAVQWGTGPAATWTVGAKDNAESPTATFKAASVGDECCRFFVSTQGG